MSKEKKGSGGDIVEKSHRPARQDEALEYSKNNSDRNVQGGHQPTNEGDSPTNTPSPPEEE